MANFAEINQENQVLRVVVIGDNDCKDQYGQESEEIGIQFCKSLFGDHTNWKLHRPCQMSSVSTNKIQGAEASSVFLFTNHLLIG